LSPENSVGFGGISVAGSHSEIDAAIKTMVKVWNTNLVKSSQVRGVLGRLLHENQPLKPYLKGVFVDAEIKNLCKPQTTMHTM
jgi:hypothetical protein